MIIKKEVEAVPLFPAYNGESNNWVRFTTGGDVVTLPRSGKVLIIDIYGTDGEFKSRFASDGNAFVSKRSELATPFRGVLLTSY